MALPLGAKETFGLWSIVCQGQTVENGCLGLLEPISE